MRIYVKRMYDAAEENDGFRVLVDRLWPRGVKKEAARIDAWPKDVAPSTELRTWFNHDPAKWDEFQARYQHELDANPAYAGLKSELQTHSTVTLLTATKDLSHSHAEVLKASIEA